EGVAVDVESLPEDDAETFALVRSGRTVGCCQLESPAMRHLLLMLQPESVQRIIQALALIRPAPASCGMKEAFVRRARGLEATTFPHPALEDVLGDTCGIMLYEDDAMLIAARLAGLSLERGDRLRKAIKRAAGDEDLRRVTKHFLRCALDNGVPLETAKDMWVQMAKFNEYSFCRAHAAGYGLVAYQSAYLKAHHPAAYMTAALNNVQGLYPRRVHLWEAKRMGVDVRGPCVNRSDVEFTHEIIGDCPELNGAIRVGLNSVKGLTERTMEQIVGKRGLTPFVTLRDFMERVHAGLSEIESLILVGAFDFTGRNRPELVWQARAMFGRLRTPGGSALGGLDTDMETPTFPPFSLEQKVNYELEILECPLSAHPVELVRRDVDGNGFAKAENLPALLGRRVRLVGILDTTRGTETKNGDLMQFLTLEDETGIFEVTLFPRLYRRVRRCLTDGGPYLVEGTVDSQYDSLSVRASQVTRLGASSNSR
ncbi:MAG TPA: OB-fold nucleic acid binding domain-containing protein, partial [Planctomycetota bacterium]|nr:OB-fold nucleic acid binding domain-containing protein [Planctomycetota bacterium]